MKNFQNPFAYFLPVLVVLSVSAFAQEPTTSASPKPAENKPVSLRDAAKTDTTLLSAADRQQVRKWDEKEKQAEEIRLKMEKDNLFDEVNVIGDAGITSFYIFWDEQELDNQMKETLTKRALNKDEFFMQNIDREEFEQERVLLFFEERKKIYLKELNLEEFELAID